MNLILPYPFGRRTNRSGGEETAGERREKRRGAPRFLEEALDVLDLGLELPELLQTNRRHPRSMALK